MPRDVFEFSCPCCGKRVELNTRSGKVRAVSFEESRRGKSFDDMVSEQHREGDRLGAEFEEARKDHESRHQKLEEMFGEAKEAAKKDKGKAPPHPFEDRG